MTIEILTNNWDSDNKERIDRNFATLGSMDYRVMQDFFNSNPSKLTPAINGKNRPAARDLRLLDNFGTNFTAEVNGIIHRAWVFASVSGKLGFGMAEQDQSGPASSELFFIEVDLTAGWNLVTLNFSVEQNRSYTIFKRFVNESITTNSMRITGWATHPFMSEGLTFNAGKFLDETGTYTNYGPFFEIEFVTSLAQVYKIANESVVPPKQFYVGDNPPQSSQFWFKPVGGA